jgi:hypothetical protein
MKRILILLLTIGLLTSCGTSSEKDCVCKLQQKHEIVYTIDPLNYIIIDSNKAYHYIAKHTSCELDKYTIIEIK